MSNSRLMALIVGCAALQILGSVVPATSLPQEDPGPVEATRTAPQEAAPQESESPEKPSVAVGSTSIAEPTVETESDTDALEIELPEVGDSKDGPWTVRVETLSEDILLGKLDQADAICC